MTMISHHLLTPDQQSNLSNPLLTPAAKQRELCLIILNLNEENVEKFLKCLEETSNEYLPHEQLLQKLRSKRYAIMYVVYIVYVDFFPVR